MKTGFTKILLFLGCVAAADVAVAEIYRWVDDKGQVHYGDRSQSDKARGVQSYKPPPSTGNSASERMEKTHKLLNAYQAERRQAREKADKEKRAEEKRQRKCAVARNNLRRHQEFGRFYRLDKEGNRVYLSDAERAASLQRTKEKVARWCK